MPLIENRSLASAPLGAFRLAPRVNRDAGVSMATATVARGAETEVLSPASEDEAIAAFGDGAGITVLAGGTIVVPEITYGYLKPERVLMLGNAGLTGVARDGSRTKIGAMTSVQDLVELAAPLGQCAANVADREIRAQATVGGNLCAPVGRDAPRGDLQAAFLALDAQVRSAGAGGERTDSVEDFLADRDGRLVLDVSFEEPAAGGFARLDRPHTHDYSALTVCVARAADGSVTHRRRRCERAGRPAPIGRGESRRPGRCRPGRAGGCDLRGRRARVGVVPRANAARAGRTGSRRPPGGRMKLTVNGVEHELVSPPLTPLLYVLREELGITSPKAGCQQGGCGSCTVLVERGATALVPAARRRARRRGDHDPRRPRLTRGALPDPDRVPRALRRAVRLLHLGHGARRPCVSRGRRRLRAGVDPGRSRRPHLSLHRLREDHRRRLCGGRRRHHVEPALAPATGRGSARRGSGGTGMKAVGARLPRYDGVAHVTGRTTFVDDVRVPGTLWVKALRSPAHNADIKRLDISKAEAMEGVHAIITWQDVPLLEYGHLSALGIPADEPLLAKDEVRYKGQPIALVAADDEVVAQAAVDAIELELAEKPALFDVRKAFDSDAPRSSTLGQLVPALRGRDGSPPDPQGLDPGGVRQGGRDRAGRLPPGGHRARPGRDAGVPGRARGGRAAHDLLLHAGALLLDGRRGRAPAGAAEPAEVRRRNRRRRLRRQGRHRDRDDVLAPGAQVAASR